MKKAHWFKFYPKDFMDDEAVKAMDYEAIGLYMAMLCHCWTNDSMPADHRKLQRIFNLSPHKFLKLWNQVSEKFYEKDQRYFNSRIVTEKENLEKDFKRNSENGLKGANKRWEGHTPAGGGGRVRPMGVAMQDPETDPETETDISPVNPVDSDQNTGPKNLISKKAQWQVSEQVKAHKDVFEEQHGEDTPRMKSLIFGLLNISEIRNEPARLLGYVIQAKRAKNIRDRVGLCIKLIKDPKYPVADGCLESAKPTIRRWQNADISNEVKNIMPDLQVKS